MRALEGQDEAAGEEVDDTTSPLVRSKTTPVESPGHSESNGLGLPGIRKQFTGTTLADRATTASLDSTPSVSEEDTSDLGSMVKSSPGPARKPSWPSTKTHRSMSHAVVTKPFPPCSVASEVELSGSLSPSKFNGTFTVAGGVSTKNQNTPNVLEVVAEAMKELSNIRQREQSQRPLRIVPQDPVHRPDDSLRQKFQELVNDELKVRRLHARDWLRVATWWLLKVLSSQPAHHPSYRTEPHDLGKKRAGTPREAARDRYSW